MIRSSPLAAAASARPASSLWGRHQGPTIAKILAELRAGGFFPSARTLHLEASPRNPMRRDYFERAAFRVIDGDTTLCRLIVGKNLVDLHRRSAAIAKACPDIICQPLFWHRADEWDYFATEFFDGENLETLVLDGRMTADDALACAEKIVGSLERTSQPSSLADASQELDRLFDDAGVLPLFGGLDQPFLDNVVFPAVRAGALAEEPRTRWTNGDLIARNVLVDSHGRTRLIDYEFAERTHFFAIDAWRWQNLSILPPEARVLPGVGHAVRTKPWLESLSILRQMALQYATNGAQIAVEDSRPAVERLIALAANAQSGLRTSAFLSALAAGPLPAAGRKPAMFAQLYWSIDGSYVETQSSRLDYVAGSDVALSFLIRHVRGRVTFRFDPAEAPGLLQISAIRLHNTRTRTPLLSLNQSTGWSAIHVDGGLLRLVDSPFLNLLSLNGDPRLLLPTVDAGESVCDLACDVWLHFSTELTALPALLPPPAETTPPAG
jgi:hypothetical protein